MKDEVPQQLDEETRERIKAEVDKAPPLSVRQREHLRRIFATARDAAARREHEEDGNAA